MIFILILTTFSSDAQVQLARLAQHLNDLNAAYNDISQEIDSKWSQVSFNPESINDPRQKVLEWYRGNPSPNEEAFRTSYEESKQVMDVLGNYERLKSFIFTPEDLMKGLREYTLCRKLGEPLLVMEVLSFLEEEDPVAELIERCLKKSAEENLETLFKKYVDVECAKNRIREKPMKKLHMMVIENALLKAKRLRNEFFLQYREAENFEKGKEQEINALNEQIDEAIEQMKTLTRNQLLEVEFEDAKKQRAQSFVLKMINLKYENYTEDLSQLVKEYAALLGKQGLEKIIKISEEYGKQDVIDSLNEAVLSLE